MIFRGHIKEGKIVSDDPITLPDGTQVVMHVVGGENAAKTRDREWMQQFVGCLNHLPANASTTVDEVLYGSDEP